MVTGVAFINLMQQKPDSTLNVMWFHLNKVQEGEKVASGGKCLDGGYFWASCVHRATLLSVYLHVGGCTVGHIWKDSSRCSLFSVCLHSVWAFSLQSLPCLHPCSPVIYPIKWTSLSVSEITLYLLKPLSLQNPSQEKRGMLADLLL